MLSACIAGWRSPEAELAHARLSNRPDFRVSTIRSTGVQVVEALQSDSIDVVLLPMDWVDVARAIKRDVLPILGNNPSLVLIAENPRLGSRARALASGFDGVIDLSDDTESIVATLHRMTPSRFPFEQDSIARDLEIIPGLLVRNLSHIDADDSQLLDLLAIGATDEDVAVALEWNIQAVRNRITALLEVNALRYRTQLAVIHLSSAKIPDFLSSITQ